MQLTADADATAAALARAAAEVDIVIDYLWSRPAEHAITALVTARSDRSRALDWIQIGAMAGPTLQLPSVALRSANLRIQGNGQGAVSTKGYLAELPSLIDEIDSGTLEITARTIPLRDVESAWTAPDVPGERTVDRPVDATRRIRPLEARDQARRRAQWHRDRHHRRPHDWRHRPLDRCDRTTSAADRSSSCTEAPALRRFASPEGHRRAGARPPRRQLGSAGRRQVLTRARSARKT